MKKPMVCAILALFLTVTQSLPVSAQEGSALELEPSTAGHIIIVALQTGQPAAAGNDFVELYNQSDDPVNVTGWKLQYRSQAVGAATWNTLRTIACLEVLPDCAVILQPQERLLLSTYNPSDSLPQPLSGGFSSVGGQVRIARLSPDPVVPTKTIMLAEDMVGYGTAVESEGDVPTQAPSLGQSLLRKTDEAGLFIDTDSNVDDFIVSCYQPPLVVACPETPPAEDQDAPAPPESTDTTSPQDSDNSDTQEGTDVATYLDLHITELLPDPVSPALDSVDEFVELFNPHDVQVNLAGYVLQSGSDYRYSFTFAEGDSIAPGEYMAITSGQSRLPLTNSGTSVRLLNPAGDVVYETLSYGQAKAGQSWAYGPSGWQWSTQPTPAAANTFPVIQPKVLAAASSTVKKTSTSAKSAATKTTKSAATASQAKTSAKTPPSEAEESDSPGAKTDNSTYWLLMLAGLAALGYVGYEYRQGISVGVNRAWRFVTRQKEPTKESTLRTD